MRPFPGLLVGEELDLRLRCPAWAAVRCLVSRAASAVAPRGDLQSAGHQSAMSLSAQVKLVAPHEASHSGLLEPRGTNTVLNEPGVRDISTWSVMP